MKVGDFHQRLYDHPARSKSTVLIKSFLRIFHSSYTPVKLWIKDCIINPVLDTGSLENYISGGNYVKCGQICLWEYKASLRSTTLYPISFKFLSNYYTYKHVNKNYSNIIITDFHVRICYFYFNEIIASNHYTFSHKYTNNSNSGVFLVKILQISKKCSTITII